ncbi:MAG: circularly permuted type 2 ATP-grasp protein [Alphaproteobacteria bacterium]
MNQSTDVNSPTADEANDRLHKNYEGDDRVYDELVDGHGRIRPHWRTFLAGLATMSDAEIAKAWTSAERLVRDYGVTYNVHGDPSGEDRPWRLDPIPLVIAPAEWRQLEEGLIQRARLLNAILADLYGEQRLLTEGALPPALVFGNNQFLRPVHGIEVPKGIYLHFLAIDLARGPDGRWWVLSDRTQAPVGAGYALENRVIMARTLPELFRDCRVERLAAFFQTFRDDLIGMIASDDPRIVIHSPGPTAETYFEHAYLARYLGLPLVEAADLTVRDQRVFLKTLTGLQPVHMIWRRVEAENYDPLSLQSGGLNGIPGIVEALRAGQVTIVNALGSGLMECDALMNFLPNLSRKLLDEDLMLPQTATWWCGSEDGRSFVLGNMDKLVIRPTFASRSIMQDMPAQVIGANLDADARADLAERIGRHGEDFIGQDLVTLSTAPGWQDGQLQPQPIALRVYLAAHGDSYRVMPGGLTRTSEHPDAQAVFMRQGEASKDTWILTDGPMTAFSRLSQAEQRQAPKRGGQDVPSRAADNLFWLGRYAERMEGGVRLLRALLMRIVGDYADDDATVRAALLDLMVDHGHLAKPTAKRVGGRGSDMSERDLSFLVFDPEAINGIGTLVSNLRRTAASVRERLSGDSWRILQDLQSRIEGYRQQSNHEVDATLHLLSQALRMLAALSGMQMENMTRGFGWRLLDMGRRLERARLLAKLIEGLAGRGGPAEGTALNILLQLADSSITYQTRYLADPQAFLVIDLLLIDDTNPRSVVFQLDRLTDHLAALPRAAEQAGLSDEQQQLNRLQAKIDLADLKELGQAVDRRRERKALIELMAAVESDLGAISDAVTRHYFSHAEPLGRSGPIWLGSAP